MWLLNLSGTSSLEPAQERRPSGPISQISTVPTGAPGTLTTIATNDGVPAISLVGGDSRRYGGHRRQCAEVSVTNTRDVLGIAIGTMTFFDRSYTSAADPNPPPTGTFMPLAAPMDAAIG